MRESAKFDISSAGLHILAMTTMLCDHLGMVLLPQAIWMRSVGRVAFPIFAFLLVEGFCHTKNFMRYAGRMFACALIAEVPFDLMTSGRLVNLSHQNVLWTFLIALFLMRIVEQYRNCSGERPQAMLIVWIVLGFLLGESLSTDYGGAGILMVLVFCFFRERTPANFAAQLSCLLILNSFFVPSGFVLAFGFEFPQQILAALSLFPVWLYQGRQGYHSQGFQYLCYAFYPAHALVLGYCGLAVQW